MGFSLDFKSMLNARNRTKLDRKIQPCETMRNNILKSEEKKTIEKNKRTKNQAQKRTARLQKRMKID